jgi:hypothetical protein
MLKTILLAVILLPSVTVAEEVNVGNFVRAETDTMLRANMAAFDIGIGEVTHIRQPTTPDNQPVIRMNQDTLYTGVVLDLSAPVSVTLPELEERYQSMQVVNQDHYMFVEAAAGTYELTEENFGTRCPSRRQNAVQSHGERCASRRFLVDHSVQRRWLSRSE